MQERGAESKNGFPENKSLLLVLATIKLLSSNFFNFQSSFISEWEGHIFIRVSPSLLSRAKSVFGDFRWVEWIERGKAVK